MLRRINSQSSSRAKSNPARKRSIRSALASRRTKSARRKNPSSGQTLQEALASRRSNLVSQRRNPARNGGLKRVHASHRAKSNPASGMTLRQALSRRNPIARDTTRDEINRVRDAYETARTAYETDPTDWNRRKLAEQELNLDRLEREMEETKAYLRGKPAKRKPAKRKASSKKSAPKRKSSSKKAKSGVAQETSAYKALRKSDSKSRFTRAFNETFRKLKRSGKSIASAQRSAIAAGKKAASSKSRKNPVSAVAESGSAVAANALRANPRKAKKKKSSSRRKPSTAAAINKHAKGTKLYKRLRTASKQKAFLVEFAKAFRVQNSKRGVTEAQAIARAALSAYAKTKSAAAAKMPARKSAAKRTVRRTARKSTKKKTSSRKTSARSSSLTAAAKKSSLYKKLRSTSKKAAFVREFKKVHAKIARKANSAAQANARAALSAYAKVNKGSTRKNPLRMDVPRDNPRKRKSTRRKSSSKRVRAKRLKGGMRKSAMQVLSKYGPYTYRVVINGKVVELKANKNSSVYKQAKKGGLSSVKLTKLRGKKNTPTSLNLRSVYKTVDGRPSKADFQRAINAWAGAIDGGKIRGVSKKDIARTRMNPKTLRKHTVSALANPAPMSASFRRRLMERGNAPTTAMDKVKLGGLGVGSFALSLYASNFISGVMGDRVGHRAVGEGLPPFIMSAVGGYGLYRRFVQKANISDQEVAVCGGLVAGSITSLLARTLVKGLGRILPGFEALGSSTEPSSQSGYLLDNQSHSNLQGLDDMSRLYGTHGVGRYVKTPPMGSVIRSTPDMGRYVSSPAMGQYIPYPAQDQLSGVYKHDDGTVSHGDTHMRSNPIMPGRISPVGANTQMVPNRGSAVPAGMYNINASELQEDLNLQEPLSQDDLNAEGLVEVYANGMQMRIIRCTPDVARQVAEANMGSIVGESRVVPGSILVLANTFDTPQNHALTDRLRLNRAPEIPKGASFPHPGGVFSRVAFSSLFPSVDNQASFQEFGVRVK